MNKGILKLFLWLGVVLMIAACNSAPTATQPAPAPTIGATVGATQPANYPAPAPNQSVPTMAVDSQPNGYPAPAQNTQAPQIALQAGYPAQGAGLTVTLVGGASQVLTLDVLKSLATVNVNLEGKDQPYRKLGDVLVKAGATGFKTVNVTGQNGLLPLNPDQVGQAYLDIQADGKIRVLVQGIPQAQWPTSVTSITVQ